MSDSEYYTADEEDISSIYSNDSNNDINFEFEYLTKQQKTIQELFQSLGFISIDDTRILSGDTVAKTLEKSHNKIIKIRQDALLLFGFKSRAKEIPDLKSTIKLINAIAGKWYGYTIKSSRKQEGPKKQRIWKYTYWIDR